MLALPLALALALAHDAIGALAYSCDQASAAVPATSPGAWTKIACTAADVASFTYTFTAQNPSGDRLTIYATDGAACSATSYSALDRYYPDASVGTFGGTTAAVITGSTPAPCLQGPPCCLFVYCDNTIGYDCHATTVSTLYTAIPPSSSPSPSPSYNPSDPFSQCENSAVPIAPFSKATHVTFSCGVPTYIYTASVYNPANDYLAVYATMGEYCSMDPLSADFKFQRDFSYGYTGTGVTSTVVTINEAPCMGAVTLVDGTYPEGIYSAPCCTIILCGSDNFIVGSCNGLTFSRGFALASATPSAPPSRAPGSSASSSPPPAASPAAPLYGSCDAVTGVAAEVFNSLDYRTWACDTARVSGGTLDVIVHNPAGDRLSVFATWGTACSTSPNSLSFEASRSVLDSTAATISIEGAPCGGSPCCAVIECINVAGYPCSPTFDAKFYLTISPAAAAALGVAVIAGIAVGGAALVAAGAALGWRLLARRPTLVVVQSETTKLLS